MPTTTLIALAIGLAAVASLCLNVRDCWFFGLLALATMVGAVGEAYRENEHLAVGLVSLSFVLGVFSARAAWRDGSTGRGSR